jgi:biopolymer transport protein ExbD
MAMASTPADGSTPLGDMNTTPLIDVMLVLFIMFIITLPMQSHAVKIDLPMRGDQGAAQLINKIEVTAQGALLWNGSPTSHTEIASLLEQTRRMSPEPELQFEPHAEARYLVVDQTLAVITRSGVGGMGFVGNERHVRNF